MQNLYVLNYLERKFRFTKNSSGVVVAPDWGPSYYPITSETSPTSTFKPVIRNLYPESTSPKVPVYLVRGSKTPPSPVCNSLPSPVGKNALSSQDCDEVAFASDGLGLSSLQKETELSKTSNLQNGFLGVPDVYLLGNSNLNQVFSPTFTFASSTAFKPVLVNFIKYVADNPTNPRLWNRLVVTVNRTVAMLPVRPPPDPTQCSISLLSPSQPLDLNYGSVNANFSVSTNSITDTISISAPASNNPSYNSSVFERQQLQNYNRMTTLKSQGFQVNLSNNPSDPVISNEWVRTITANVSGFSGRTASCSTTVRILPPAPTCASGIVIKGVCQTLQPIHRCRSPGAPNYTNHIYPADASECTNAGYEMEAQPYFYALPNADKQLIRWYRPSPLLHYYLQPGEPGPPGYIREGGVWTISSSDFSHSRKTALYRCVVNCDKLGNPRGCDRNMQWITTDINCEGNGMGRGAILGYAIAP